MVEGRGRGLAGGSLEWHGGGGLRRGEEEGGGERDAEGDDVLDHRDPSQRGGWRRQRGAQEQGAALPDVDVLVGAFAEGVERGGEGSEGGRRGLADEDARVISEVAGHVAVACDGDAQAGLGAQVGGEGLGDEEVEEGGEGAALPDAAEPQQLAGLDAVGVHRSRGVGEEQLSPGDHAVGGPHDRHSLEDEGAVY
jgi:hypothetical protein